MTAPLNQPPPATEGMLKHHDDFVDLLREYFLGTLGYTPRRDDELGQMADRLREHDAALYAEIDRLSSALAAERARAERYEKALVGIRDTDNTDGECRWCGSHWPGRGGHTYLCAATFAEDALLAGSDPAEAEKK